MEENEYKQTYQNLNPLPCVFEKALLICGYACAKQRRLHLAEREAAACTSTQAQVLCRNCLVELHRNAQFALHLPHLHAPLPHAKALKLQCGGLQGLQNSLHETSDGGNAASTADIYGLLNRALACYGNLTDFPYQEIVRAITHYQGRRKKR